MTIVKAMCCALFYLSKMNKIETKSVGFESLSVESKSEGGVLNIKGYASIFGNIDSYGDIIHKGAYESTLSEQGSRVKFCYNHNLEQVCGKINEIKEDNNGLYIDVDILPTSIGKDVAVLMEAKAIDEFSIGYRTIESHKSSVNGKDVRNLTKLELIEVSAVTRAANSAAKVITTQRKSEDIIDELAQMPDDEFIALKSVVDNEKYRRLIKELIK